MKPLHVSEVLFAIVCCVACLPHAQGNTIFRDTFNDGDAEDGMPVTWTPLPDRVGNYDASSGDYVLSPIFPGTTDTLRSLAEESTLADTSIRSQVSLQNDGSFLIIGARDLYFAFILRTNSGSTRAGITRDDSNTVLSDIVELPFDVLQEDAVMQFDVIGNSLRLWVWPASGFRSKEPQATAVDDTYESGLVSVGSSTEGRATFRYVHVADMHIPEPSALFLAVVGMLGLAIVYRRRLCS